jgi:hypothetical protein
MKIKYTLNSRRSLLLTFDSRLPTLDSRRRISLKIVDLHIHSNLSDGIFSPVEIVRKVAGKNLGGFSLTDHDSFDGIGICLETIESLALPVYFIAGCEFSTYNEESGEIHILGYFSDDSYRGMDGMIEKFKRNRLERAGRILDCLKKYRIEIDLEELLRRSSSPVGRMHIAREMTRLGFTGSVYEAFEKYLGDGRPCNIQRKETLTYDVISLVLENNGIPVLAHPLFLKSGEGWKNLDSLISAGLAGIEYVHPMISPSLSKRIEELYSKRLILTGGSDYHGDEKTDEMGLYGIPVEKALEIMPAFSKKAASI